MYSRQNYSEKYSDPMSPGVEEEHLAKCSKAIETMATETGTISDVSDDDDTGDQENVE